MSCLAPQDGTKMHQSHSVSASCFCLFVFVALRNRNRTATFSLLFQTVPPGHLTVIIRTLERHKTQSSMQADVSIEMRCLKCESLATRNTHICNLFVHSEALSLNFPLGMAVISPFAGPEKESGCICSVSPFGFSTTFEPGRSDEAKSPIQCFSFLSPGNFRTNNQRMWHFFFAFLNCKLPT